MSSSNLYARGGYFMTETRVVVNEFFEFESSILPSAPHHLEREIIIKQGAKIIGDISGGLVILGQNVTVMGSIICDNVRVGATSKVEGGIYARFEVSLDPDVRIGSNIFGQHVSIGSRSTVDGNVMGSEYVEIQDGCTIKGLVFSHNELKVNELSEVDDILAVEDITLGSNVIIKDSTIWSVNGNIQFSNDVILHSDSERPVRLEDAIYALRKNGQEITSLLPAGYYYVHSVDKNLEDNFDEVNAMLLEELTPMLEFDFPKKKDSNWHHRVITQSVDLENLVKEMDEAQLYGNFPSLKVDMRERIQEITEQIQKKFTEEDN